MRFLTSTTIKRVFPVALLLPGVAWFWLWMGKFAYLPGTDAYYYALQAQSILDTGHLKVPGNGILYYAIAWLAKSGISVESAYLIVLGTVFTFLILALWFHAARLRQELRPYAMALILIALPVIAFQTIEFPRLSLALACVPVLLRLAGEDRALHKPGLWLIVAGAALLHPLLAVFDVLFVGGLLLSTWRQNERSNGWQCFTRFALALMVVTGLVVGVVLAWPGLGLRLASLSLGRPGLLALSVSPGLPLDLKLSVICMWLLLAATAFRYVQHNRGRYRYLPLGVLALALWPDPGNGFVGVGGRLALAFVVIAIPVMFIVLEGRESLREPSETCRRPLLPGVVVPLVALLMLLLLPLRASGYVSLLSTNDYKQYTKVVAFLQPRAISMLIAPRGMDFYYTYLTQRDAFHFDPEPDWKIDSIWRVAARVTPEELVFYAPDSCLWGHSAMRIPATSLLLVHEDCWERFRANISARDNPDLYLQVWQDAENPSRLRPAFLRSKYQHIADKSG